MKQLITLAALALLATPALAQDYTATTYDWETGNSSTSTIRSDGNGGYKVKTYDWETGNQSDTTVKPLPSGGYNATTYDWGTGNYSTTTVRPR